MPIKTVFSKIKKKSDEKELERLIEELRIKNEKREFFNKSKIKRKLCSTESVKKIFHSVFSTGTFNGKEISFNDLEALINSFCLETSNIYHQLDLMLSYVEIGREYLFIRSDSRSEFFLSLERVFKRSVLLITGARHETIDYFLPRFSKVVKDSKADGLGLHEPLSKILNQFMKGYLGV